MTPEQRKNAGRDVERELERFYERLDQITPTGVNSLEWLGFVEGCIGSGGAFEGYEEWVNETWEPLDTAAVAA